jgi:hypothetical protein
VHLAQASFDPGPSIFGGIIFILLLALWIPLGCALLTAWLASERGRANVPWFFLGLVFGPIAMLAVGLAPENSARERIAASLGVDPYPPTPRPTNVPPPAPPPPRVQPVAPGAAPPMQIDVDAAVFHEGSQTGYARGRTADGALVYVRLPNEARVRDISDQLLTSRPVPTAASPADVVPVDQLPPELRG